MLPTHLHPSSYQICTAVLTPEQGGRVVKMTTHLQLAPRLRRCGAITAFPQYIFRAITGLSQPSNNFNLFMHIHESRESSAGIALDYGMDDGSSTVRFPAGAGNFSLHHRGQNGSGAHPASYPMGTRGSFPGGKVAGA
jgi:hypothetical protein